MAWVNFTGAGSPRRGLLVAASSGIGPGVLVIPAWWGLNSFFQELCENLGMQGFTSLGFDLYNSKTAETIAEAEALRKSLDRQAARNALVSAAEFLSSQSAVSSPRLGVLGFSLGANLAARLAEDSPTHIAAVVLFYGKGGGSAGSAQAAYQLHTAENDEWGASPSKMTAYQKKLVKRGLHVEKYVYQQTGHWFFEKNQGSVYAAEEASLAWGRTLTFLHEQLNED